MAMFKLLTCILVCVILLDYYHVKADQNVLEQGKIAVLGAIAKGKEILDHGVNIKSERQQSYDVFGLKFGTSNGIGTGFGDAASEKTQSSAEDDLVRRRKRSLDVLAALRAAGLFSNSATGANVNFVKINSVSNVNNYGPETTTASARRRRSFVGTLRNRVAVNAIDQKASYVSSDTELSNDKGFKSHTAAGSYSRHLEQIKENEIDYSGFRKRRSLGAESGDDIQEPVKAHSSVQNTDGKAREERSASFGQIENKASFFTSDSEAKADGSIKTDTFTGSRESKLTFEPDSKHRSKRSPQETGDDADTTDQPPRNGTRPGPSDGNGRGPPSGRPRGPPPGGRRGDRGAGPGKRRGPPPPSEESNESGDAENRKKREADENEDSNQSNSSYYSDSSSDEEDKSQRRKRREINATSGNDNAAGTDSSASDYYSDSSSSEYSESTSEEDEDSESSDHDDEQTENQADVQRRKRSPCRRGSRTTTPPPNDLRRRKREAESQEDMEEKVGKDVSWFSDVMDRFFKAVKKVADTAKQVFNGGSRGGGTEQNADAENI